ncbi:competence-induced protein CoiA-like protein [Vibrio phage 1.042.O._10N.286.45.B8]|nr:competence-induced protein CoiA-like protein [Vibrio phage 1.042.O._10N.286.45.B8]
METMEYAEVKDKYLLDVLNYPRFTHIKNAHPSGVNYTCTDCGSDLVVKKGDINKHHFAHKSKVQCEGSGMTVAHKLMQDFFTGKRDSYNHLLIGDDHNEIYGCDYITGIINKYGYFEQERHSKSIKDNGNYIYDLVAYNPSFSFNDKDLAVIEITMTHHCSKEKFYHIYRQGRFDFYDIDLSFAEKWLIDNDMEVNPYSIVEAAIDGHARVSFISGHGKH